MLFGEVGGIDLSAKEPPVLGEINVAIGKSSAEALSAMIKGIHYKSKPDIERFLTSVQYDTLSESTQLDGNFKIDDDIHFRGFSRIDSIEGDYKLKFPKEVEKSKLFGLEKQYSELSLLEKEIGELRRKLEYKKSSLYTLWEMYKEASKTKADEVKKHMDVIIPEITNLRDEIYSKLSKSNELKKVLEVDFKIKGIELEPVASEPFYQADDPSLLLFGKGMNRTYAFGEEGRFESDNKLFCLTEPLSSDISKDRLLAYFKDITYSSKVHENYTDFATTSLLLDTNNLLAKLNLQPNIKEKFSPVLYNSNPMEEVTLFMQWQSEFHPNYDGANPEHSKFKYGNTDYSYKGTMKKRKMSIDGITPLTPHGVYNLQDKLKKYLDINTKEPEIEELTEKVKDIAAVSQNLSGFSMGLSGYKSVFQYPINIDPKDPYSEDIAKQITPDNPMFYEPQAERLAVNENTQIFPIREGFFNISKLALVSTFGRQRKLLDDDMAFKGTKYFSENLFPIKNGYCSFPLSLSSAARLSTSFVPAVDKQMKSSPLPNATPIICIVMPDILNRSLNIFSNTGKNIGTIKTAYRTIDNKKIAVGKFAKSPLPPTDIDQRITDFISALTQEQPAMTEVMAAIDKKINSTLPLVQNDFIFGRALVLAEVSVQLEFFGAPEWSKKNADIGKFNDVGLSEQEFPIYFGDKERVLDGLCCGFYNGYSKGFCSFGAEKSGTKYLNEKPFSIKSSAGEKNLTLLFDPTLKVTVNTGFLPEKQLEMEAEHIDFSKFQLLSAELNTIISSEKRAELPDFTGGTSFSRFYPKNVLGKKDVPYIELAVVKPPSIGEIDKTIITDGVIIKTEEKANND